MDKKKKSGRYSRIYTQLEKLLEKSKDTDARMATAIALLHHKMAYFFWTGFYVISEGELVVRMYQGPVACQVLEKGKGVCWEAVNGNKSILIDDVHKYSGHIACDARSNSEIVIPVRSQSGEAIGVLDVDSTELSAFDEVDVEWLEKIIGLINS